MDAGRTRPAFSERWRLASASCRLSPMQRYLKPISNWYLRIDCISVGHKTQIPNSTLLALSRAGVEYISTRSVGYNHIDVQCAQSMGISVETVAYSPDSVADYTLMLMLMAVRNAKSTISRAQVHDYRLNDVRGKELRDMTIGVIGTGRIGAAVIDRLRGFGCRVLAYDRCPKTSAEYVPLDELLQQSDVVTLHTPLSAEHAPSPQSSTYRADAIRRIHHQHGTRFTSRHRGASLWPWKAVSSVARRWMSSKAKKESSTPTTARGPSRSQLLLRLQQLPNVLITPHTAYYTEHALRDIVENTLINCRRFERRAAWVG